MVWVRVEEADDFEALFPGVFLNADKLFWINGIAIVGRVGTDIDAGDGPEREVGFCPKVAYENAATFFRVFLLAVLAQLGVSMARNNEHREILACAVLPLLVQSRIDRFCYTVYPQELPTEGFSCVH